VAGVRGLGAPVGRAVGRELAQELCQAETAAQDHGRRHRTFAQRHAVRTSAVQRSQRFYGLRQFHQVPGCRDGTPVLHHEQVY